MMKKTNMTKAAMQGQMEENNLQKNAPALRFIGKSADGYSIFDRTDSHIHLEGGLTDELLKSAVSMVRTSGKSFFKAKCQFEKPVGYSMCVPVSKKDNVLMVYRKGRKGMTPMVKGRNPEPCSSIIVILKKDQTNHCYILVSAFIGNETEKEPWDAFVRTEEQRKKSITFWTTHALIYDENQIDWERTALEKSSTETCGEISPGTRKVTARRTMVTDPWGK